jgi:sugar transferase (PEP-CTERM system associated)
MFFKGIHIKAIILLLGDVALIAAAYFLSPLIRFGGHLGPEMQNLWTLGCLVLIYPFVFYLADLYDFGSRFRSSKYLYRFIIAGSLAAALALVTFFFWPPLRPGRGVFLLTSVSAAAFMYVWRLLFEWCFKGFLFKQRRILIAGAGKAGRVLYQAVKSNAHYHVVGYIDDDPLKWGITNSPTVFGGSSMIGGLVAAERVDSVVIAIPHLKGPELLKNVLDCKMKGVRVYDMPSFYKEANGKLPVEYVDDFWFVNTPMLGVARGIFTQRVKRLCDVAFSAFGLLASLPVAILTALAIKIESKGPVFFRQKRVGLNNEIFTILKFRSMREDAECNGAVWAEKDDPRTTRVGKVIRKLRIDEIPQMWNVLKGEMSLIGPRPERPEFVESLTSRIQYYSLRHFVKPGITGWAQVNYPYGASEKDALEKLQYDLFYIKNLSAILEFQIFLRTIKVVLFGRGAR